MLGWAGLAAIAVVFGGVAYRLEQTRDLDILRYEGARIGLRQDGRLLSIGLKDEALSDGNLEHVGRLKQLRFLTLEDGRCSADGLAHIRSLRELKGLRLRDVECPRGSLEAIGTLPKLSSVVIENCPWIGDEDVRVLVRHSHLDSLTLHGTSITDAAVDALSSLNHLDSLTLENSRGGHGVRRLIDSIRPGLTRGPGRSPGSGIRE